MGSNLDQYPYLLLRTTKGNHHLSMADKTCWTIGRSNDNDLVLSDHWVSRNHAMLQQTDDGEFFLVDLGSRNGTFVNGRRVSFPIHLRHRDQISFGLTRLEFYSTATYQEREAVDNVNQETFDSHHYERRLVSVLIVNIHDFTLLTKETEDNLVAQTMGQWLRQANQILQRSGCFVSRYISDTVVGIWFHDPGSRFRQILSILKAAHDFAEMTTQLADEYSLSYPLQVGIGISTGYGIVNKMAGNEHCQCNVFGSPINTAIRLQNATRQLTADVIIGKETYQSLNQVEPGNELFTEHQLDFKGSQEQITVYATNFDQLGDFLVEAFLHTKIPPDALVS